VVKNFDDDDDDDDVGEVADEGINTDLDCIVKIDARNYSPSKGGGADTSNCGGADTSTPVDAMDCDDSTGCDEETKSRKNGVDRRKPCDDKPIVEFQRDEKSEFVFVYHLYVANKTYSKTSRGAPAYRVFMRRPPSSLSSSSSTLSTSSSPSASDLKTLFSSYRDGAPLLFASVAEGDDPSFVAYYDVTLPPAPVHFDVV